MCCSKERLVDARCAVFKRGDRIDNVVESFLIPVLIGGEIPRGHRLGEVHRYVGAHAGVLAALAWEEECDVAALGTHAEVHASRRRERSAWRLGHCVDGLGELASQIVFVGGDHGESCGFRRVVDMLARLCEEGQLPVDEVVRHLCCLGGDVHCVRSTEHHHFDIAAPQPRRVRARSGVLRQCDVEV